MLDIIRKAIEEQQRAAARRDEKIVRALLERWASELEPAIAMRDGKIIGLTLADAPLGSSPPIFNPFE